MMPSRLDDILTPLQTGNATVDETCRALAAAVRADSIATRMWPMLIESRITQQQLSQAVGRALIDAMENFEPEKTMWIAPASVDKGAALRTDTRVEQQSSVSQSAAATTSPAVTGSVLNAPTAKAKATTATATATPRFQDMEQLRAFLWDGPAAISKRNPITENVEWLEDAPKRVPPPRPIPGVTPVLPAPEIGSVVKNRYRLDAHLGYGGIGQVFSATDLQVERSGHGDPHVTIKLIAVDLKHEPQALMKLQNAVTQTKSLRHPNIVSVYGVEHDADRLFIVMEPLVGRWLGDQIRQVRNVGIGQDIAWPIIEGIANGLAYAHQHDVVHSDLSPYAVFLTDAGTPKIMGFGLIHALPTSNEAMDLLDTMTLRAYSEAYTADTWAMHATPHPTDDLYPLGVIAYELLTGAHPFNRHSLTTARQKNLEWKPIPDLNRRASKLIAHCLSFERTERPKNASRFIRRMQGPALLRMMFGDKYSLVSTGREE